MTKVKICGVTNLEDARWALQCGADALGFVFAKSPRQVTARQARGIITQLGPWTTAGGVFVNDEFDRVMRIARECPLSAIQFHGDEDRAYVERFCDSPHKVIKAFRVDKYADFKDLKKFSRISDAFLFDTKTGGQYGGTGKSFEWVLLKLMSITKPFILSGGLNSDNVKKAVRCLSPYGVDVSSGVERSPGKKNRKLEGVYSKC